jgi:Flp pilus assembly pilin Flp
MRRMLRRLRRGERGQTVTEYLMISGFAVVLGLFVMKTMQVPLKQRLRDMASYVLNNAADLPW